jgi:hypothetical protein
MKGVGAPEAWRWWRYGWRRSRWLVTAAGARDAFRSEGRGQGGGSRCLGGRHDSRQPGLVEKVGEGGVAVG